MGWYCDDYSPIDRYISFNGEQIKADFARITHGRTSQPITDRFTAVYNESQIFVEEGVNIKAATLNAEKGLSILAKM
jgi:hypothetical protein